MEFDDLSNRVIGCAIQVHRELGPGLLESTYEQCVAYELNQAGIPFKIQHPIPVSYKEIKLDCGYRVDLLIDDQCSRACIHGTRNPVVAEPRFITSVLDGVSAVSASERGESARNGVAASLSERVLDLCKQCLWTDAHSKLSLHAMALPLKG